MLLWWKHTAEICMWYDTNCEHDVVTRLKLFHISHEQSFPYPIQTLPRVNSRINSAGFRQIASHCVFDNKITSRHANYRPFGSRADQSLLDWPHRGPFMREFFFDCLNKLLNEQLMCRWFGDLRRYGANGLTCSTNARECLTHVDNYAKCALCSHLLQIHFIISCRIASLDLGQSQDCPSAKVGILINTWHYVLFLG